MLTSSNLHNVIEEVSGTDKFYYPVVDSDRRLVGAITLGGMRNTFKTQEVNDWLVALDIMEDIVEGTKLTSDTPLSEAFEKADKLNCHYFPVVSSSSGNKFSGLLDCGAVKRRLSTEVLARQEKADNIHGVQCA